MYNSLMKRFLIIASLLLVAGCRPFWIQTGDVPGPPEYKLGWQDGCDSGLSAEGGWGYKLMYGFKKRTEMASNDQYKTGWGDGFNYCRFSLAASKGGGSFEDIGLGNGF